MAKCAQCGKTILFGGKTLGDLRFCNAQCQDGYRLSLVGAAVPEHLVDSQTREIHSGLCPRCKGNGPIDVYHSHHIVSALIVTQYSSKIHVCCRSCATKSQVVATVGNFFLGWWGFPFGLVMTPVQIVRNITGMFKTPDPYQPSDALRTQVQTSLAMQIQQAQIAQQQSPPL